MRFPTYLAGLLIVALFFSACDVNESNTADLILINGKVVTIDEEIPDGEAIAIRGDTILAIGTSEEVAAFSGEHTEVIDLDGQLAIPGFIEGHAHFMGLGYSKMILDLAQARTWDDIVKMVEQAASEAEPGEWITGRGWHQEKWEEIPEGTVDGVPTHHSLSDASPDNPVLLRHASGHASFANALALELGRVSPETPNPSGGEIVRDIRGEATGLLRERAQGLVQNAYNEYQAQRSPEEIEADMRKQALLAAEASLEHGITSFQDAGSSFQEIDFFKQLVDEEALPIRLYVMVRGESHEALEERLSDYYLPAYGDQRLNVRSIKMAIDGALGPHGAWLLEPYEDMPQSAGLNLAPIEDLVRTSEIAIDKGFQVCIHAIGDRANKEVLDIYESFFAQTADSEDLRWRIEHAQHLHPDDIQRMADLNVIASMQGVHATSDGPWVIKRLGELRAAQGAYMWQALWEAGATVTNGTDAPVERISALESYYATVFSADEQRRGLL